MRVDRSPTPFSVTCGVVGLIAGPSKALRHLDSWVRFIGPLQPVVAATDLRTRHECWCEPPHPGRVAQVGHRFWRRVGPVSRVSPLYPASKPRYSEKHQSPFAWLFPSGCLFVHMTALQFDATPPDRIVFTAVVLGSWLSRREPQHCPSFRRISSGWHD